MPQKQQKDRGRVYRETIPLTGDRSETGHWISATTLLEDAALAAGRKKAREDGVPFGEWLASALRAGVRYLTDDEREMEEYDEGEFGEPETDAEREEREARGLVGRGGSPLVAELITDPKRLAELSEQRGRDLQRARGHVL